MRGRFVTMVGLAVVFGGLSILVADYWLRGQAEARVPVHEVAQAAEAQTSFETIVVASAPVRFGMTLERAHLSEIAWAQDAVPEGAFSSIDALLGDGTRVVLSPIEANEPILLAKLSGPDGRATLSNLLGPGMRAVTIKTDEIAGVGGFITPGDRVDVVLTRDAGAQGHTGPDGGGSGSTMTSQIVVSNAKVLSVGQGADERQTEPNLAASVTIEVSTQDASKVALARTIGSLSLSLRSGLETGDQGTGVTTVSAFSGEAPGTPEEPAATGLFGQMLEPEGPKFTTITVTRGLEAQTYQVVSPEN